MRFRSPPQLNITAAQREEAARVRLDNRHQQRRSHAEGLLKEIDTLRKPQYQAELHIDVEEAERRVAAIENELVADGFTRAGVDLRESPAKIRQHEEAKAQARRQRMSEARGIRAELERHRASDRPNAGANVAHAEQELGRVLGLPDDADLDAPGLIDPVPEPRSAERRRGLRPRMTRKLDIHDPVKRAEEDRRSAKGLPRDHEPGFYHEVTPGRVQ